MEMQSDKKYSYLDEFKIMKTLSSGYHAQVKLGLDLNGRYVAIKKYKRETANLNTLKHELNIMKALQHQNLVKLIDVRQNATYKSRSETEYQCFAIILEYVGGGELFDFIADTGKFSEKVSRTYFHQMMNGLHFMHDKGYAHRDIKPENILLSHQFVLKLADFGFSCLLRGKDNSGILHTKLGTEGYMAPEIPSKNYQGTKTDIFAAAVILFIMYAGNPPFEKAAPNDPYYKLIRQKNFTVFWAAHSKRRPANFFSQKFRDLFIRMVASDPAQRISMEEISQHPWVTEPVCKYDEIKGEFTLRHKKLEFILEERRREEEQKKTERMNAVKSQGGQTRGDGQIDVEFVETYTKETVNERKLGSLERSTNDDLVLQEKLPYVLSSLRMFFQGAKIKLEQVDEDQIIEEDQIPTLKAAKIGDEQEGKMSVTFEYQYGTQNEESKETVQISLAFGVNSQDQLVIGLQREAGNQLYFKKIVRELKNKFAYCAVDKL